MKSCGSCRFMPASGNMCGREYEISGADDLCDEFARRDPQIWEDFKAEWVKTYAAIPFEHPVKVFVLKFLSDMDFEDFCILFGCGFVLVLLGLHLLGWW